MERNNRKKNLKQQKICKSFKVKKMDLNLELRHLALKEYQIAL